MSFESCKNNENNNERTKNKEKSIPDGVDKKV